VYVAEFAALLWPFQFGIALVLGMQFLVHAFHALLDKYLPGAPPGSTCSQAFIQFDLTNMFNAASQMKMMRYRSDLVPIFDLLYYDANMCWYQKLDESWDVFPGQRFRSGLPIKPFPCLQCAPPNPPSPTQQTDAQSSCLQSLGQLW